MYLKQSLNKINCLTADITTSLEEYFLPYIHQLDHDEDSDSTTVD